MSSVGIFTVCDMENVGRLFYDTHTGEWAFEMPIGVSVRVKFPLKNGEQWAVCGSYKLPGAGKRGNLFVRAGQYPSTVFSERIGTLKNIATSSPGVTNIGCSVNNQDHWNGHLRSVVIGPQGAQILGRKLSQSQKVPQTRMIAARCRGYWNGLAHSIHNRVSCNYP